MKKLALTVFVGLVPLVSLACGLITSQFQGKQTKTPEAADTPVVQGGVPDVTETSAPEATETLAPEPTVETTTDKSAAGQIVFVSCRSQNVVGQGEQCGISIMNADGSNMRELTDGEDDSSPVLSPDGTKVAFEASKRDGNHDIYVINTDGSNLTRLTTNKGEDITPSWSPDGTQILYMSDLLAPGDPSKLYISVMGADGSNPHPLIKSMGGDPAWSPDGTKIVFVSCKSNVCYLNVMNADGTHARVIKPKPVENIARPAWSTDGSQIAFFSQKTITSAGEVNVINVDGSNQRSLTPGLRVIFVGLSWSPDGTQLLFSMRGDGTSLQGDIGFFIVNADGSDLHKLDVSCTYCYDANWGQ